MRLHPSAVPTVDPRSESQDAAPAPAPAVARPLGRMTQPRPAAGAAAGRRQGERVALQTQVDLVSDSNLFTGFGTNIGEGGLFVATVSLLPIGTPVDLTFTVPGAGPIRVKGEVRWMREVNDRTPDVFPGVGVRFVDLDPAAAQALHRFVSTRDPLFYPD